jgi:hypothetical protein
MPLSHSYEILSGIYCTNIAGLTISNSRNPSWNKLENLSLNNWIKKKLSSIRFKNLYIRKIVIVAPWWHI